MRYFLWISILLCIGVTFYNTVQFQKSSTFLFSSLPTSSSILNDYLLPTTTTTNCNDKQQYLRSSSKVPLHVVNPEHQAEYDRIDNEDDVTKCKRYGLEPSKTNKKHRIFFGAMLANENWDVIHMHAIETYDLYTMGAFVESNTTHMGNSRSMNYNETSPRRHQMEYSQMFGPSTKIRFGYWNKAIPDLVGMDRESEQRNKIVELWKEAGMTEEDIGLMSDMDEVMSRDFLRAVQRCDLPELRIPLETRNCRTPKIVPMSISFETSPYCIKHQEWYHPDMLLGACIDGIGDPSERFVPLRNFERQYGERDFNYGKHNYELYPDDIKNLPDHRFPLFSGADIRAIHGSVGVPYNFIDRPGEKQTTAYGVAYHFHNWFTDIGTLRDKYETYAHGSLGNPGFDVYQRSLSQINEDLDVFVRCVHRMGTNRDAIKHHNDKYIRDYYYLKEEAIQGPRPIYFKTNKTYTDLRHRMMSKLLFEDEEQYGFSYDNNGRWCENNKQPEYIEPEKVSEIEVEEKKPEIVVEDEVIEDEVPYNSDNKIHIRETPNKESLNATVMGMATGIALRDLQRFVNSLRNTGFGGTIILGIMKDPEPGIVNYLQSKNVTIQYMSLAPNCTFPDIYKSKEEMEKEGDKRNFIGLTTCMEPYPDVKIRWVKYPLGRDWLQSCQPKCSGPVLLTDVRDVYFQRDPFGLPDENDKDNNEYYSVHTHTDRDQIQLFQEHPNETTSHWLIDWPVGTCKGRDNESAWKNKPMLCSGTTIATSVKAMMFYLNTMYDEMKLWLSKESCRFKTLADDQSIHNWLYYSNQFESSNSSENKIEVVSIPNRQGIVHTVGYETDVIFQSKIQYNMQVKKRTQDEAYAAPLIGQKADGTTWISSKKYQLTDGEGYFTNSDRSSRSRIIHQWDRASHPLISWLDKEELFQ